MSQSEALLDNTSRVSQFYALTKPRVVQLIVFCALIGMVLAVPDWPTAAQWVHMGVACAGIWLVAAAAAGFRHVFNVLEGFEGEIDAQQHRGGGDGWRFHNLPWVQD